MVQSATVDKRQVCDVLEEIGVLLELKGENRFRSLAYARAARALEGIAEDLSTLVREERLAEIPGIGEALTQKITELVTTGHLKYYDELRRSFPDGLLDLLRVPGLGPKKVKILYDELHIKSLDELERACRENRLLDLAGLGQKPQENLLKGLAFLKRHQDRRLYPEALAAAEAMLQRLRTLATQLSVCGSLRRCAETVGDVDILTAGANAKLMHAFTTGPQVERVLAHGETKSSVQLRSGIQCDLRLVSAKEFPYAQLYFTGSNEHNVLLRQRAIKRGLKLNEYGLFKGEKNIPCKDEAAIYKALGLAYIPPELREGLDELELADSAKHGRLPALVETKDITGTFHTHTIDSDGRATLAQMVEAAQRLGYSYMGLSDHSQSAAYANGMKIETLTRQQREVDALNARLKGFRILKGAEVDILHDGSLDYPDRVLATMDFVIASVHSRFSMPEAQMTERIITAMRNPYVTMLGHPTGRLLLAREAYAVNLTKIIDAAGELGVIIELNANPHRFDLDWRMCRYATARGVRVSINPDAHDTDGLTDTAFGVGIARKGGLTAKDVFNTQTLTTLLPQLMQRRRAAGL